MRASERLLTLALICLLGACHEAAPVNDRAGSQTAERASEAAAPPPAGGPGAAAQAPYGVIADVEFSGDPSQFGADARVYVFLRAPGQRMPIAVHYFEARELPKQVFLSTRTPLSNAELVARLSRSGRIERSREDPETTALLDRVGHPPATVRLALPAEPGSSDGVREPPSAAHAAAAFSVRATVSIDSAQDLAPDTPVFVIARAGRAAMPLAVRKLTVAELPARIELGDADSMLMSRRLSSVRSFSLQARVSATGRTERSDDDPESEPVTIDSTALPGEVTLAIRSSRTGAGQH